MKTKNLHYFSGVFIAFFMAMHLLNHASAVLGAGVHLQVMDALRMVYRHTVFEGLLLLAVGVQVFSGLKLFFKKLKQPKLFFDHVQLWSGFYLALFFVIHLSAVFTGRLLLHLDTNFYFGVAGLNTYPYYLFFVPYYSLAIISVFGHLAAVHYIKMKRPLLNIDPRRQAVYILISGCVVTLIIIYGLTGGFTGIAIPPLYKVLVGGK